MSSESEGENGPPKSHYCEEGRAPVLTDLYVKELDEARSRYRRGLVDKVGPDKKQWDAINGSEVTQKVEDNEEVITYDKWKTKNNHLYFNSANHDDTVSDMVSNLGRKLESNNAKIVQNPTQNIREVYSPIEMEDRYSTPGKKNPRHGKIEHPHLRERYFNKSLPLPHEETRMNRYINTPSEIRYSDRPSSPSRHIYRERHPEFSYKSPIRPPHENGYNIAVRNPYSKDPYYSENYPIRNDQNYSHPIYYPDNFNNHHGHYSDVLHQTSPRIISEPSSPCIGHSCSCHSCKEVDKTPKCKCKPQKNKVESENSKPNQFSLRNLYRIVWLQNEQLSLLQKQINKLMAERNKMKEVNGHLNKGEERSDEKPMKVKSTKLTMEKVSVGVMTSFVQSPKFPHSRSNKKTKKNIPKSISNSEEEDSSKFEEKEDSDIEDCFNEKFNKLRLDKEESFILQGMDVPTIAEQIPTPETSLHIDIQEYKSSSGSSSGSSGEESGNSSDDESTEDSEPPTVGWTFYDNVVDQVNNLLNKSKGVEDGEGVDDIRSATLDQLRKIGVSLIETETQAQKRVTFDRVQYPRNNQNGVQQKPFLPDSDSSMHINALAMKYLKAEQAPTADAMQEMAICNMANGNNNLSYATLKYLERYQLVPPGKPTKTDPRQGEIRENIPEKSKKKKKTKVPDKIAKSSGVKKNVKPHSNKILDITAIKQQPKLLPKKT